MNYEPMNFNTTMQSAEQIENALTKPHNVKVSVRNQHVFIVHDNKITHVYKQELLTLGCAVYSAIMREMNSPHLMSDADYLNSEIIFTDDDLYLNHTTESAYI